MQWLLHVQVQLQVQFYYWEQTFRICTRSATGAVNIDIRLPRELVVHYVVDSCNHMLQLNALHINDTMSLFLQLPNSLMVQNNIINRSYYGARAKCER